MQTARRGIFGIEIAAAPVFFAARVFSGVEIVGHGMDPDRLLPAAYGMAGAFVVPVPCMLFRIYVRFDRKYRSETESNQKSHQTEEKQ